MKPQNQYVTPSRAGRNRRVGVLGALGALLLASACQDTPRPPLELAPRVDIARFMGPWYVIACIPTRIETQAFNAVESYQRAEDGRILTTFTFNKGGFDGPEKRYHPVGYVHAEGNGAIWDMQFLWPIRADYRVMYVDEQYTRTIIGRQQRDYVWIMARSPQLADDVYADLLQRVARADYDVAKIRKVPQRPGEPLSVPSSVPQATTPGAH